MDCAQLVARNAIDSWTLLPPARPHSNALHLGCTRNGSTDGDQSEPPQPAQHPGPVDPWCRIHVARGARPCYIRCHPPSFFLLFLSISVSRSFSFFLSFCIPWFLHTALGHALGLEHQYLNDRASALSLDPLFFSLGVRNQFHFFFSLYHSACQSFSASAETCTVLSFLSFSLSLSFGFYLVLLVSSCTIDSPLSLLFCSLTFGVYLILLFEFLLQSVL